MGLEQSRMSYESNALHMVREVLEPQPSQSAGVCEQLEPLTLGMPTYPAHEVFLVPSFTQDIMELRCSVYNEILTDPTDKQDEKWVIMYEYGNIG